MPSAAFFRSLGLFIAEDFLSEDECVRLRDEMKTARLEKGRLYRKKGDDGSHSDDTFRQAYDVLVAPETAHEVRERLLAVKPQVEEHFRIRLGNECHGPDFVTYKPGGFFAPHRDINEDAPEEIRKRRVCAVAFLNASSVEPAGDSFGGGGLTFYGLLDGRQWENCGLTLEPQAGLLVAFRPDVLHQVQPVTFGERHIILSCFLAPEGSAA